MEGETILKTNRMTKERMAHQSSEYQSFSTSWQEQGIENSEDL